MAQENRQVNGRQVAQAQDAAEAVVRKSVAGKKWNAKQSGTFVCHKLCAAKLSVAIK